jgi:streptolysin S family bacteriocin protoxin
MASTRIGGGMFMRPISTCWPSTCQVAVDAAICCCSHCVCVLPSSWRRGVAQRGGEGGASKPLAVKKLV